MNQEQPTPGYIIGYIQNRNDSFIFETVCHAETGLEQAEQLRDKQAAALEMYEALTRLIRALDWDNKQERRVAYKMAKAALAKANPQTQTQTAAI